MTCFQKVSSAAVSSGGALVALVPVLKAYVERNRNLRIKIIKMPDGKKEIEIEAEHFKPGQIEQTAQAIKQLCDDA